MLKDGKLINPEIRIEVTNQCNAKCITCPRDSLTRPLARMEFGLFVDILNEAKDLGVKLISLFGFGESLLHPDLHRMVDFCSVYGFDTFLTTNASLLNVEISRLLLDSDLTDIRFSVHGLWEKYDHVHRKLNFHDTLRNIQNFLAMKKKWNKKTRVHIISIPMTDDEIPNILEFWVPFVDFVEIWKPHNWGGAKGYRGITGERKKTCGRPFSGPVQVQVDGSLIPCCFLTNNEMVMGSMNGSGMRGVLEDEPYRELQRKHTDGDLTGTVCDTCDQLNMETESPLLWSNRDSKRRTGRLSSSKFELV